MVGEGAAVLVRRALTAAGLDPELPGALDRFLQHYNGHLLDHTRPYPGMTETLQQLATRLPLAVLTNKPAHATERVLEGLELQRFFARRSAAIRHSGANQRSQGCCIWPGRPGFPRTRCCSWVIPPSISPPREAPGRASASHATDLVTGSQPRTFAETKSSSIGRGICSIFSTAPDHQPSALPSLYSDTSAARRLKSARWHTEASFEAFGAPAYRGIGVVAGRPSFPPRAASSRPLCESDRGNPPAGCRRSRASP